MSLGELVYGLLAANSGVANLAGTRIYPLQLPQNTTYPAISYQRISNAGQQGSTKLRETRYQINSWGATYAAAQSVAIAVKAAFEEYTSITMVPEIKMALVVNETDDYDPEADIYRIMVDVMLTTSGD